MASTLDECPEDVLDLIISYVNDQSSLLALTRVSKQLYQLAEPHLYSHVSLYCSWKEKLTPYLCQITLLLLQRPQLARCVRRFTLRSAYNTRHQKQSSEEESPWKDCNQSSELDAILKRAIKAQLGQDSEATNLAVDGLATEYKSDGTVENMADEWFRLARAGFNEAAVLAILLPNLVNLRFLDIPFTMEYHGLGEGYYEDTFFMIKMMERAARNRAAVRKQPILNKLSDVIVPGTSDEYPDNPLFFGACISLPAIKRVFGFNQGNDSGDDEVEPNFECLKASSSSVESIHLRNSKLNIGNFSKLLQSPACLKLFIYEIGSRWAVDFSEIQRALEFQKDNLEKLCLSYETDFPFREDDELGSLTFAHFSALKHLRVAPIYLYGIGRLRFEHGSPHRSSNALFSPADIEESRTLLTEALPKQLETLAFIRCDDPATLDRLTASLDEVLIQKAEQSLRLCEVSIHTKELQAFKAKQIAQLKALPWSDQGVRFVFMYESELGPIFDGYPETPWGWDEEINWAYCNNNLRGPITAIYDSSKN